MTKKQKNMLKAFANGEDVNVTAQIAIAMGGLEAVNTARTILALLKAGMLQHAKSGGLEISDKGRAQSAKGGGRG